MKLKNSPFFSTIKALKGNQKAAVIAEPLWAVPYYLFLPFASMYMSALGISDARIGFVVSLGLALQFFWSLLSGAIIDKYGRRLTMLVFSLVSWAIPCALWATAQSYWHFIAAIFFNSMWRVTGNCFSCIIVEDCDQSALVRLYTIFGVIGLVAGFLTPITGFAIERMSLVPAMRALYLVSLALMSAKAFLLYFRSSESGIGKLRMAGSKDQPLFRLALGGWREFTRALRTRRVLLCVIFMALFTCFTTVQTTFFPLFVTGPYKMSGALYSMLPLLKSAVMLFVYLIISPRIRLSAVRRPLFWGLFVHALGLGVLLLGLQLGGGALVAAFFAAVCDALAFAILSPLGESLMAVNVPHEQRARINSLITAFVLLLSMPAGWAAGQLSAVNRALPFVLNLCLLATMAAAAFFIARGQEGEANSR
ncbi:MAG: MFS transporter [Clostridiaceae bacterium]